jgi:Protein of unknown function (DUF2637)
MGQGPGHIKRKVGESVKYLYRFGWAISAAVALAVSAYSLFYVGRAWGLPLVLAGGVSLIFDGASIVSAEMSLRISRVSGHSGASARIMTVAFAGLSAWINSYHAQLAHQPNAWVLYAAPPIVAVCLFEQHVRYESRAARKRAGRVALPAIHPLAWVLYPMRTPRIYRGLVGRQLGELEGMPVEEPTSKPETRTVRAWAQGKGIEVRPMGALPRAVVEAYMEEAGSNGSR